MSGLGEALLGRALEIEEIQGVEHYVPGQHAAELLALPEPESDDPPVLELGFVSGMGAAVRMIVAHVEGRFVVLAAASASIYTPGTLRKFPDVELSEAAVAVLEDALR